MPTGHEIFSSSEILKGIKPSRIGKHIYCFKKVDSTNRVAKILAEQGIPDGTLIVADYQTAGRGRISRSWIAPPGSSILCSFILYPPIPVEKIIHITMISSLAALYAIADTTGIVAGIKWPNDLYIDQKKVSGILLECDTRENQIKWVVIGIGINVNFDPSIYRDICDIATSLSNECGTAVSRIELLRHLIFHFDDLYNRLLSTGFPELKTIWEQHSCILNKSVTVTEASTIVKGTVCGFTDSGHLILKDDMGQQQEILWGDVSLRIGR